jgi:hypothetical protein
VHAGKLKRATAACTHAWLAVRALAGSLRKGRCVVVCVSCLQTRLRLPQAMEMAAHIMSEVQRISAGAMCLVDASRDKDGQSFGLSTTANLYTRPTEAPTSPARASRVRAHALVPSTQPAYAARASDRRLSLEAIARVRSSPAATCDRAGP